MKEFSGKRLLIANRGEIAARILRTAQRLGFKTFVVHSSADRKTPAVQMADGAFELVDGETTGYLDIEQILAIAQKNQIDAIHPGYGFLSENPQLSRACEEAGIRFVGPRAEAIDLMADKRRAKDLALENGVPCLPGAKIIEGDLEQLIKSAEEIGYPLLLKATLGGGGRGIRKVDAPEQLESLLSLARQEAAKSFKNDEVILEKFLSPARHIEVQILADGQGGVVHLGERDCSLQRRHQKVVEEAPSLIDTELREKMGQAAENLARASIYRGAGTVEFLVGPDGQFYFLEMNTRLQVEHPATEMITGLDLVEWQLGIAFGKKLDFDSSQVSLNGHAIEVRLNAEDPDAEFLPQSGWVRTWEVASSEQVRVDHWMAPNTLVTNNYDSLLAKIIVHGKDREEARRRMIEILKHSACLGLKTNKEFLLTLMENADVAAGKAHTTYIDDHLEKLLTAMEASFEEDASRASLCLFAHSWQGSAWSNSRHHFYAYEFAREEARVKIRQKVHALNKESCRLELAVNGSPPLQVSLRQVGLSRVEVEWAQGKEVLSYWISSEGVEMEVSGRRRVVLLAGSLGADKRSASPEVLTAPMSGSVVDVQVEADQEVEAGQVVAVLEAMKMQMMIKAEYAGQVTEVYVEKGQQVRSEEPLVFVKKKEGENVVS